MDGIVACMRYSRHLIDSFKSSFRDELAVSLYMLSSHVLSQDEAATPNWCDCNTDIATACKFKHCPGCIQQENALKETPMAQGLLF
jgi:hypothetical protein